MGTVLTKMGILPVLVTLSAVAAAFTVWLPGGLNGEEDINARTREKRQDDEYDYYGYDDVLVPPTDEVLPILDLDENGNVPCQSVDQCPADFDLPTTKVTYSCKAGVCYEGLEEDLGVAGGFKVTNVPIAVGISYLSIGNPYSGGVCHALSCKRKGKCCLLVTVGRSGKRFGCPPSC